MTVDNLYARSVLFVKDAEQALGFYTETLGFSLDWNHQEQGRTFIFQVSLFGFQVILNQIEPWTKDRVGHGRVFIGLNESQVDGFLGHIEKKGIKITTIDWGAPTVVIHDQDQNEFFFWLPESQRVKLATAPAGVS